MNVLSVLKIGWQESGKFGRMLTSRAIRLGWSSVLRSVFSLAFTIKVFFDQSLHVGVVRVTFVTLG